MRRDIKITICAILISLSISVNVFAFFPFLWSAPVTVRVGPPEPDFELSAVPSSQTISQGETATYTITVTSINGFNQPVQLTVSGAPSQVIATLNPEEVTPPPDGSTNSKLTVSASATVTPGNYTLTVTGTSDSLTHNVDISLKITTVSQVTAAIDELLLNLIDQYANSYFDSVWNITINQYKAWIATIAWAEGGKGGYVAHSQKALGSDVFNHRVVGDNFRFSTGIGPFQLDRGGEPDNWHNWPTIKKLNPEEAVKSVMGWHYRKSWAGITLEDFAKNSVWYAVNPTKGGNPADQWRTVTGTSWDVHKKGEVNLDWNTIKNQLAQNAQGSEFRYETNIKNVGTLRWNITEGEGIKTDAGKKVILNGDYPTWLITARSWKGIELFNYYYTYDQAKGIEVWVWDNSDDMTNKFRYIFVREYTTGPLPEHREDGVAGETLTSPAIIENLPPVADAGLDKTVFSGDFILLNGSNSYDADGRIISYRWDFGDRTTAEGKIVSHRFRGAQNEPKTYTVTLTVEDNNGATTTDTVYVTVTPLEKTVEVSKSQALAKMTVTYNWIEKNGGEDIYIISKIYVEAKGFVGTFVPTIWVWEPLYPLETQVPTIKFLDYLFARGIKTEKTYESPFPTGLVGVSPPIATRTFREGTFQGIQVKGTDVMSIYMQGFTLKLGWPPIDVELFEFSSTSFDPHAPASEPSLLQKLLDKLLDQLPELLMGQIGSAGELRVYDSEGRVTGLVNGLVKQEIPNSIYFNNTIIILSQGGSYRYEVAGTEDGPYGLIVASYKKGNSTTFTATDIPISTNAVHQYTIDWIALSQGQKGATVQIDSNGDGTFEKTFTAGSELTRDEFLREVPIAEAFPMWIVGVAVAAVAIATVAIAVFWRRRKQPPTKG